MAASIRVRPQVTPEDAPDPARGPDVPIAPVACADGQTGSTTHRFPCVSYSQTRTICSTRRTPFGHPGLMDDGLDAVDDGWAVP